MVKKSFYAKFAALMRGDIEVYDPDALSDDEAMKFVELLLKAKGLEHEMPELAYVTSKATAVNTPVKARALLENLVDELDKGLDRKDVAGTERAFAEFGGETDSGRGIIEGNMNFRLSRKKEAIPKISLAEIEKLCVGSRSRQLKATILLGLSLPGMPFDKEDVIGFSGGEKKRRTYLAPDYILWLVDKGMLQLRANAANPPDIEGGERSALMLSKAYIGGDTGINKRFKRFIEQKRQELALNYPDVQADDLAQHISNFWVGMRKPRSGAEALYATSLAIAEMESEGMLKRLEQAAPLPKEDELSVQMLMHRYQGGNVVIKSKLIKYHENKTQQIMAERNMDRKEAEICVSTEFAGLRKPHVGQESYYVTPAGLHELLQAGILKERENYRSAMSYELGCQNIAEFMSGVCKDITKKVERFRERLINDIKEQCPHIENPEEVVNEFLMGNRKSRNGRFSIHAGPEAIELMMREGVLAPKTSSEEVYAKINELRSARSRLEAERDSDQGVGRNSL